MNRVRRLFSAVKQMVLLFFVKTPVVVIDKSKRAKSRRGYLLDLLSCVEAAFESTSLKADRLSWVDADTRKGLQNLGPWVPYSEMMYADRWNEFRDEVQFIPDIQGLKSWPGLWCIDHNWYARNSPDKEKPGMMTKALAYGRKLRRCPWYVEQSNGVIYEYGLSYKYGSKSHWMNAFLSIDLVSGRVRLLKRLVSEDVVIPCGGRKRQSKHGKVVKISAKQRAIVYQRRGWKDALSSGAGAAGWGDTQKERESEVIHEFVKDFRWWGTRKQRWNTSVQKNGQRVTFSVDKTHTKYFFKDRDKTVVTPSGQRKKIIHYVRAHERLTRGKVINVREHIRGIRQFSWNGYWVNVTAPDFHVYSLNDFDVSSVDSEDQIPETKYITNANLGNMLARLEDQDQRKRVFHKT